MNGNLQKWVWTFIGLMCVIGASITHIIIYLTTGELNLSGLLGILAGFVIIFLINAIYVKTKKHKTPAVDERTITNLKKFYAIAPHIYLGIIVVCLVVLSITGVDVISTSYLWLAVMMYIGLCGVGAFILNLK
ncbi:hypothetical protein [Oceanobacillus timonensis]|uniref:hypothetical protein n=1 Tax=Oceanobacillus timonensis TaxID=1926285 RepID=UPI0009BC07C0|nr:hypothetical protein [Oceanobacillus timonensis]